MANYVLDVQQKTAPSYTTELLPGLSRRGGGRSSPLSRLSITQFINSKVNNGSCPGASLS